jgi:hypothetical protein
MMEYLSVAKTAEKWGLSERSVRNYCAHGRIADAKLIGKTWYVPKDAKIVVNLGGHSINRGLAGANGDAMYIDAGADVTIRNGTVIGGIDADKNATATIKNVYVAAATSAKGLALENYVGPVRVASIFGEGTLSTVVAILALGVSVACVGITLSLKKKLTPSSCNNTEDNDESSLKS